MASACALQKESTVVSSRISRRKGARPLIDQGVHRTALLLHRFGNGCAISVASASMMTELVNGKSKEKVEDLFKRFHEMCTTDGETDLSDDEDFERLIVLSGVRQFPVRVKCATLAWHTMEAALKGEAEISTER